MNNTEIYKYKSLENLDGEIWKTIIDFEDYQVSNFGRVKSLNYKRSGKEGILTQSNINGYLSVNLYKNKIPSTPKVHRLVVISFIPNPLNLPVINHLDGCKTNNNMSNLEWCTQQHNVQHSFDNGLRISKKGTEHYMYGKKGKYSHSSKIIYQYSLTGKLIKFWYSITEAEKELNIIGISAVAKGKRKSADGFKWSYDLIS